MFITSRSKQRKAIKSKYAPGFLPENWSFVCLLCYVGLNRLKVSAFCRSGFFKYDGGSQRKALWWSSFLHQCVTLSCSFTSPVLIQYDYLTCHLIITESVLLVFTPLSKFFLSWSYRKGPKEKRLNAHIIMTEFPWLVHHKPRVSAVGCFERKSNHLGLDVIQQKWKWLNSALSQGDVLHLGSCGGSLGSTEPPWAGRAIPSPGVRCRQRWVLWEPWHGALTAEPGVGMCLGPWQPPLEIPFVPLGWSREETFLTYTKCQSPDSRKEISSIQICTIVLMKHWNCNEKETSQDFWPSWSLFTDPFRFIGKRLWGGKVPDSKKLLAFWMQWLISMVRKKGIFT